MISLLKQWWPSILASITALWGVFGTQLIALVAAHPKLSTVLAAVAVVIAHLIPSPVQPPPPVVGSSIKLPIALFLLLFCATPSRAQTNVAPPLVFQHFVVSVNAAGYGTDKGMVPVTILGTAIQLTTNLSVGYNQIFDPSTAANPNYHLGVVNYTRELGDICPFCKDHFVFDTTSILTTFQGGAGKVVYTLPGASSSSGHIAATVGAFVSIPLSDHMSFQLIGVQGLFGAGNTRLTRNVTQQISSGIYFTF